ncbi:hypothetical protein CCHR01_10066 [Colletotrichum chrysophilum]|uniref:Uncharacterized protein n=1 Tax=Colletotrichum chrysophilum TaxID=1836956 RepID=A0AAD9EJP3_9PEZI|nr:hypothetical protein CCHR01_10066 [Colletotrichum chrysophilum]
MLCTVTRGKRLHWRRLLSWWWCGRAGGLVRPVCVCTLYVYRVCYRGRAVRETDRAMGSGTVSYRTAPHRSEAKRSGARGGPSDGRGMTRRIANSQQASGGASVLGCEPGNGFNEEGKVNMATSKHARAGNVRAKQPRAESRTGVRSTMEAALCEWVSWFVVRISIPAAVTSVAAGVEQSGDKDPADLVLRQVFVPSGAVVGGVGVGVDSGSGGGGALEEGVAL